VRRFPPSAEATFILPGGEGFRALRLSIERHFARSIDLRLLFDLSHRFGMSNPWLRRARPHLHVRDKLITLTN